ncbi:hypothetical protein SEA_SQUEE_89 [Mycobacterium phage Squee]
MNEIAVAAKIVAMFEDARKGCLKYGPSGSPYFWNKKVINGHIVDSYDYLDGAAFVEIDTRGTERLSVAQAIEIISAE